MIVGFYLDEMNLRGVANSTFSYAYYNEKILMNKSIIFYNSNNYRNNKIVINKFKKHFKIIAIHNFLEIDDYKEILGLKYIYVQKSGNKDKWVSKKIKTLVHAVYPQKLDQIHGYKYAFISRWLSKYFSNDKIDFVPYIVENFDSKKNLRKLLKIKKKYLVLGFHGGSSSFDLKFVQDAISQTVFKRDDIFFIFLNVDKFVKHPRIIFLKGTFESSYKRKFLNTCDAMIYARSLGESFGLSCGEFAILGKKIISYRYNQHKNHINSLSKKQIVEYYSYKTLLDILCNFKKDSKKNIFFKQNEYLKFNSKQVMKIFKKVFFINKKNVKITFNDKFINFISYMSMFYNYICYKIYTQYYDYFYSKIFKH